ncbi:hypothetical protein HDU91_003295 [Kappamyces sp. JEL0680]|nr:hypothetical protein HDU91_003295 [Kappamyces sp. JEL0680]
MAATDEICIDHAAPLLHDLADSEDEVTLVNPLNEKGRFVAAVWELPTRSRPSRKHSEQRAQLKKLGAGRGNWGSDREVIQDGIDAIYGKEIGPNYRTVFWESAQDPDFHECLAAWQSSDADQMVPCETQNDQELARALQTLLDSEDWTKELQIEKDLELALFLASL